MKSPYTVDSIKALARTSLLDDANGNKVPGVLIHLLGARPHKEGARAQVLCQYFSYGGTGEFDEYNFYVNGVERDEAFIQHLLDTEEHPAMSGHGH